jgi:hypothetical protein
MAAYVKINDFVEHLAEKEHDLGADQLTVALSNTAPGAESPIPTADGNGELANVTEISYTNLSSRDITTSSSAQTSGTYQLTLTDLVLTASGSVATFRYIYIYNDAGTTPTDPLICHYDYGSALTLENGDSLTLDFDGSNGLLQIA